MKIEKRVKNNNTNTLENNSLLNEKYIFSKLKSDIDWLPEEDENFLSLTPDEQDQVWAIYDKSIARLDHENISNRGAGGIEDIEGYEIEASDPSEEASLDDRY